ncbi:hypothetical protein Pmani_034589 [Petrolisthes manimaculis]|uniref:Uncharacterized protein n=1 Tax=Petrolisthes manimaculis TaxID=1843537 RepID=A0AAE1TPI9_9EUCA|nr:hypothetical protein Pmani_034589 [Petrolisthes manimaculis]
MWEAELDAGCGVKEVLEKDGGVSEGLYKGVALDKTLMNEEYLVVKCGEGRDEEGGDNLQDREEKGGEKRGAEGRRGEQKGGEGSRREERGAEGRRGEERGGEGSRGETGVEEGRRGKGRKEGMEAEKKETSGDGETMRMSNG